MPETKIPHMIDNQATDKMAEMVALINEYSTLGRTEVETEASSEYRRRAWVIANMLSEFAGHAANSDLYNLQSDSAQETDKERQVYFRMARLEDFEFMKVLREFDEQAQIFKDKSAGSNEKTDAQLVQEIEILTGQLNRAKVQIEHAQEASKEKATKKKIKNIPAFVVKDVNVIAATTTLTMVRNQLSSAITAAAERGIEVKFTKFRTVVKKLESVVIPALKAEKKKKVGNKEKQKKPEKENNKAQTKSVADKRTVKPKLAAIIPESI